MKNNFLTKILWLCFMIICCTIKTSFADTIKIYNLQNGHYYQRFDQAMSWHEAVTFCANKGAHLVTITSEDENNFIYELLDNGVNNSWTGGTDEKQEGKWEWITGEKWDYNNWPSGEPNGYTIENYLHIFYHIDKYWNDIRDCGQYPICEWEHLYTELELKEKIETAIQEKNSMISLQLNQIKDLQAINTSKETIIAQKESIIDSKDTQFLELSSLIDKKDTTISDINQSINICNATITQRNTHIENQAQIINHLSNMMSTFTNQYYKPCNCNNYSVNLTPGWHLMSAVNNNAIPKTEPEGSIDVMYQFKDGTYIIVTEFIPGHGYWVKINQPCEFIVEALSE